MKKKLWLIPVILIALIALLFASFFVGIIVNGMAVSVGQILTTENGDHILIKNDMPISLSNRIGNPSLFDGLTDGDIVFVIHDGIQETYPARSGATCVIKIKDGNINDIKPHVLDGLVELGWWHNKDNAQTNPETTEPTTTPPDPTDAAVDTHPQTEPTEAPAETTIPTLSSYQVYLPNENVDGFVIETASAEEITEDIVLAELQSRGVLPESVEINAFDIVDGQINIDFNQDFGDLVCSMGTSGELMIVGSVVNTFLDAFHAKAVCFTVDGQVLESGHVVYDFPITLIEPQPLGPASN